MTTYRWAVVHDQSGGITLFVTEDEALKRHSWLMTNGFLGNTYTVKKFKLVECEEGEGDGE